MRLSRAFVGKAPDGVLEEGHRPGPELYPWFRWWGVGDCKHRVLRPSHPCLEVAIRPAAVPHHRGTLRACGLQLLEGGHS